MRTKPNLAQTVIARKNQVARAIKESQLEIRETKLNALIASYEVAKAEAKKDAIKKASVALKALKDLLELAQANGLSGDAVDTAELVLVEYEILPIEDRGRKVKMT